LKTQTDLETAILWSSSHKDFKIFHLFEKKIQSFEATCLKSVLEKITKYCPQTRRSYVSLIIWLLTNENSKKNRLLHQGKRAESCSRNFEFK